MRRIVTKRDMGDGTTRHRVRIEGDDCPIDGLLGEQSKWLLLQNIVDNPALVACGYAAFQSFRMHHDGGRWIIEAEALVKDPPTNEQSSHRPT